MPIVFSAIVPHSPLLIDRIGKTNRRKMAKTLRSYREIERLLYAAKPDTIAIVSPHAAAVSDTFHIGMSEKYTADFEPFGDFSHPQTWVADTPLAQLLRASDETRDLALPIALVAEPRVDYGVAVPLTLLTGHLAPIRVVALHTAMLGPELHWRYGQYVGDHFRAAPQRIALIASADLSQQPQAASQKRQSRGAAFDRQLLELIRKNDAPAVVKIDPLLVQEAACCGYLPITTLLGALDGSRYAPVVLSYEGPFGVGLLTAYFDFSVVRTS